MNQSLKTTLRNRLVHAKKIHPSSTFDISKVLQQVTFQNDKYIVYTKKQQLEKLENLEQDEGGLYYTNNDRLPQKIYVAKNEKELAIKNHKIANFSPEIICETKYADQVIYHLTGLVLRKEDK